MTVAYVDASSTSGGATTTLSINLPALAVNGHYLLAMISSSGGTGQTLSSAPAGWTALPRIDAGTNVTLFPYWKFASSEPASYTWTYTSSQQLAGGITAYSGVNGNPINVSGTNSNTTANTAMTASAVTPTEANTMIVASFGWSKGAATNITLTPPTSYTERYDVNFVGGGAATGMEVSDLLQASSGVSTGTLTATASTQAQWAASTLALRSAPTQAAAITRASSLALLKTASKPLVISEGSSLTLLKTAQLIKTISRASSLTLLKTAQLVRAISRASSLVFFKSYATLKVFAISQASSLALKKTTTKVMNISRASALSLAKTTTKRMAVGASSALTFIVDHTFWLIGRWGGR